MAQVLPSCEHPSCQHQTLWVKGCPRHTAAAKLICVPYGNFLLHLSSLALPFSVFIGFFQDFIFK